RLRPDDLLRRLVRRGPDASRCARDRPPAVARTQDRRPAGPRARRRRVDASTGIEDDGASALAELGIEARPGDVARGCLDWTEQRHHVAGALGRAFMARLLELRWLARDPRTRALRPTDAGRTNLPLRVGVRLP